MLMELHRITLTKSQLAALPPAERSLLLLLGHASNEINVLSKLILMVRKDAPPSRIAEKVEAGQACVLLRVLVGQLHVYFPIVTSIVLSVVLTLILRLFGRLFGR